MKLSNFTLDRWRKAEAVHGSPVISNQVQYSLACRGPDRSGLTQYAADNERVIIAYSPLAQGFLAAKYDATNTPGGVRAANSLFLPENLERGHELIMALREVAKAHDAVFHDTVELAAGVKRTFLEDGDSLVMRGWCQGDGYRVGFGEVEGTILAAE